MSINVSNEIAEHYSSGISGQVGIITPDSMDDSNIFETNYQMGKQLYDDLKTVMGKYSEAVERDAKIITDISWQLLQADNEMMIED